MAPLTRNRSGPGGVPSDLAREYYGQRASAAVIISEATAVSSLGVGYPRVPGLFTDDQVDGWRRITRAVHARGGRIVAQLCHNGRVSHPAFHGGLLPVAPSALMPPGQAMTEAGVTPYVTPRALETGEIDEVVHEFEAAASRARDAEFDGIEIHAANGFLVDQFLRDGTNRRTDGYGGSPENRARLLLEIVAATNRIWSGERIGVRLSPLSTVNGMVETDPLTTFSRVTNRLSEAGVGYLHLVRRNDLEGTPRSFDLQALRARFRGPVVMNGGYDRAAADETIRRGAADFISFGTAFLANPDLPARLRSGTALNEPDKATFYTGGARGYVDYPTASAVELSRPPARTAIAPN
jgi:N-ethylmaleimide reductase